MIPKTVRYPQSNTGTKYRNDILLVSFSSHIFKIYVYRVVYLPEWIENVRALAGAHQI